MHLDSPRGRAKPSGRRPHAPHRVIDDHHVQNGSGDGPNEVDFQLSGDRPNLESEMVFGRPTSVMGSGDGFQESLAQWMEWRSRDRGTRRGGDGEQQEGCRARPYRTLKLPGEPRWTWIRSVWPYVGSWGLIGDNGVLQVPRQPLRRPPEAIDLLPAEGTLLEMSPDPGYLQVGQEPVEVVAELLICQVIHGPVSQSLLGSIPRPRPLPIFPCPSPRRHRRASEVPGPRACSPNSRSRPGRGRSPSGSSPRDA